ncbi:MAG: hypothetical protein LBC58_07400, partial [Clostridiales Family XIII bacterium]|nr:hypothetical protein [Clostridiales Family XIII bacterium]
MKSKQNNQSKPKTVRRCRTVMVMLLIIALVIPQAVLAANEGQGAESVSAPLLTAGDPISITLSKSLASNAENGYEVSGSILTFNANAHGKAYIISQETGHGFTTITVSNNVNADITINSISMNSFALSAGANVNLALKGNNTMSYGLRVPSNATVSIDDNGDKTAKLTAAGYYNCAAIGGGAMRESCGTINILGGTITANGGGNAAAIGGGCFASGGNITISGGTVTANGIVGGAGIGGGHGGNGGTIKITGGTVTANQTNAASTAGTGAGIGGGTDAAGGAITISGGTVKAAAVDGAAIGMGADEGNNGNRANDTNIKITGGTVTATASGRGAAIGGGRRYGGGTIEISGAANVTATGGNSASGGAGIGSGYDGGAGAKLTLASTATVKAYSRNTACQAINAASVSGDAYFINAQLNTERTAVTKLKAYGPDGAGVNTDLSLPANYPNFAYTTGSAQPQENYILAFNDSTNIFEGMIVPTLNNEGNTICT